MDNEQLVKNWQRTITRVCIEALGRQLTDKEAEFIQEHQSFLALESIGDQVRSLASQPTALASYLNSGASHASA
jgi:hypothetical protein